jgi:hypothetical protein
MNADRAIRFRRSGQHFRWISRAAPAVVLSFPVVWWPTSASQGPGGSMGAASPLTQLTMAIVVYGISAIVVGPG